MRKTKRKSIEYRDHRIVEVRVTLRADQGDAEIVRWRITRLINGIEQNIAEASSLEEAKAKVDKSIAS